MRGIAFFSGGGWLSTLSPHALAKLSGNMFVRQTESRQLGMPRVNLLELNLALNSLMSRAPVTFLVSGQ
ncbi:hypothetical protein [Ottowia thiooxydans]